MKQGCLGFLLKLLGKSPPEYAAVDLRGPEFPYGLRDRFLSEAELSFYHVLLGVLDPGITVVVKPRLLDVLYVKHPHQNLAARNRIDRKHVDFLLCDSREMKPIAAVELDDASHSRSDRQERDDFVDQALAAAGLPLVRIKAARAYAVDEVRSQIAPAVLRQRSR